MASRTLPLLVLAVILLASCSDDPPPAKNPADAGIADTAPTDSAVATDMANAAKDTGGPACTRAKDCPAGTQVCELAQCVGGECGFVQAPNGWACDDDNACTTNEVCQAGSCEGGAAVPCDDQNPCTSDSCVPADGKCNHAPTGGTCEDGNPCTNGDTCKDGKCAGGGNVCDCQDAKDCANKEDGDLCNGTLYCDKASAPYKCKVNPKTVKACNKADSTACAPISCDPKDGACKPKPVADKTGCDDGQKCTVGDVCMAGTCKPGSWTCQCADDKECAGSDDGDKCNGTMFCDKAKGLCAFNPASVVHCPTALDTACVSHVCEKKTGACKPVAQPDLKACNDNNPCTAGEACQGGVCKASPASNSCSCKSDGDCAAQSSKNKCDGALFCSLATGKCEVDPSTIVVCPTVDDTACASAECVPKTGACVLAAAATGTACDDGDLCTTGEVCGGGLCLPSTATNTCECEKDADCPEAGNKCLGPRFCNQATKKCEHNPAQRIVCEKASNTACAHNWCNPVQGACEVTPVHQGHACDDGNAATEGDFCDVGKCVAETTKTCGSHADCAKLDAGNKCNGTLYCDIAAGQCKVNPGSVVVCSKKDDSACQAAQCDPATGACALQPSNLLSQCDDGDPCTAGSTCDASGKCVGGTDLCACHVDKDCVAADDGDLCNGVMLCDTSAKPWFACALKLGSEVTCSTVGNNDCQAQVCAPATGTCSQAPIAAKAGKACEDGDACTASTACVNGVCSGVAVGCDDNNGCTSDACDKTVGCIYLPLAASPCDDGDPCTKADACAAGKCVGKKLDCDDGNLCTDDVCDAKAGACKHSNNTVACKDGDKCGAWRCEAGKCAFPLGSIVTLAGTGAPGFSDGDALVSQLYEPHGVALSKDGSLLIADGANHRIRRLTKDGQLTTVAGSGLSGTTDGDAKKARFHEPVGVLELPSGDIVVAEKINHRLRVISAGQVSTLAGSTSGFANGKGSAAKFSRPFQVVRRPDGSMLVSDRLNHMVRTVQPDGAVGVLTGATTSGYKDGPLNVALFHEPLGLALGADGAVYIVDSFNSVIRRAKGGQVDTIAGVPGKQGMLDGPAKSALFGRSDAIVVLPDGALVIGDDSNGALRRIADGVVTTLAGRPPTLIGGVLEGTDGDADGPALQAMMNDNSGLALGPDGALYIGDSENHRIRALLPAPGPKCDDGNACTVDGCAQETGKCFYRPAVGTCTMDATSCKLGTCEQSSCKEDGPTWSTIAGSGRDGLRDGPAAAAYFSEPDGIELDDVGNVWIADTNNNRVRKLLTNGAVITAAGNDVDDWKDGKGTAAAVDGPEALVWHAASKHMWFVDSGNNRVRRIAQDHTVTTMSGSGSTSSSKGGFADGKADVARFWAPSGLAWSANANVFYVSDTRNCRVRSVTLGGVASTVAGGSTCALKDGPATVARFNKPEAIAVDKAGNAWVVDTENNAIRRVDVKGAVVTVAGSGAAGNKDGVGSAARFDEPDGVVVLADGSLLVSDENNYAIRQLVLNGTVATVSTVYGGVGGWRDGGKLAMFHEPSGFERRGEHLWMADADNHRVYWRQPAAGGCPVGKVCKLGQCAAKP